MSNAPQISSLIGLVLDITGFILISMSILIPPKQENMDETINRYGSRVFIEKSLSKSMKANIGFYCIILGFIGQFTGTLLSLILR